LVFSRPLCSGAGRRGNEGSLAAGLDLPCGIGPALVRVGSPVDRAVAYH